MTTRTPPPIPCKPLHLSSSPRRLKTASPFTDVANTHGRTPDTAVTAKSTQHTQPVAAPPQPRAVPFPTISEEGDDEYVHDALAEGARGREWAKEIARRQANIQELRGRKLRLEQAHTSRPRKQSPGFNSLTPVSSLDRKQSIEDIDFIAALHASVVWRLWHADLTPTVFASERLLATRLHLVLMRHGRQNIPVPPIVAVPAHSHSHPSQISWSRHMMEKDRPGIQTLPQLVAKSMLRQKKQQGRRSPSRNGGRRSSPPPVSPSSQRMGKGPSPLSRESL